MNTHDIDRLIDKIESSAAMDIAGRSKYIHDLRAAIEADRKRRGEPVAWVAADTLNSPHPACVSSLAYMSQLDREQGREYVPLYAAPVAAQTADDARDAARYRWLRKGANDDIAVVRGLGAMDYGMSAVAYTYSEEIDGDDLDAAIDRAMKEQA